MIKQILILTVLFTANILFAGDDEMSIKQKVQAADELYKQGSYYNAIEYYKSAAAAEPNNGKIAFKLAEANMKIRDFVQAEKWYKSAINLGSADELALFNYGKVLKFNGKYDQAIETFKKFKTAYKGTQEGYLQLSDSETKGAEMAKLAGAGIRAEISNIGEAINSPSTEFAPFAIKDDRLLYSSLNVNKAIDAGSGGNIAKFAKIYESKILDDKWQKGMELPTVVNASGFHNGNPAFSQKSNTLYFTRCITDVNMRMMCDIFASKLNGNAWSEATKLSVNAPGANNTQPAIINAEDGSEYLYFVSNRVGGKGGDDIYYAKGSGTSFAEAKNASKINTFGNENSPTFDAYDKSIYFSSDGHPNFGGLDIFKTKGIENDLSTPSNVGFPINSNLDDFYFSVTPSGEGAFVVSNRPGTTSLHSETCCDDIFEAVLTDRIKVKVKGSVSDIADGKPIDGAKYELRKKGSNGEILATQVLPSNTYDIALERGFEYELITLKDGFEQGVAEFNTKGIKRSKAIESNIRMRKKAADCKPVRTMVSLEKIYFDFDKSDLTPMAVAILNKNLKTLQDNNDMVVELQSHTDGKGTDEYNIKLSERRTNSVFSWLIERGIDKSRLNSTYMGETKPEYPNTNPDGSDNEGGRQLNRRTEFILMR
jgi:outer membrane protein OmpA-like peptidoglycan-associated protein/tetratricopeptide (TPR) repeat protein